MTRMTTRLRQYVSSGDVAWSVAAYDGLTAKLACEAGFQVISSSGFQIAASMGMPDAELYTMSENLSATRNVVSSSTVPVIADCDTGYGNAINVMRTVREFERIGVAGLLLEDQVCPKRCPAMAEPEILPIDEAVGKIRAAVAARTDPDLVIIGRTDALSVPEACVRLKAYAEAGADMVLTISRCPKNYEDLLAIRRAAGKPLKLIMSGWVEDLSVDQIKEVSSCAGWALTALLTATEAVRRNLGALREMRDSRSLPMPMTDMAGFKKFIGFPELEELQQRFIPNASGHS